MSHSLCKVILFHVGCSKLSTRERRSSPWDPRNCCTRIWNGYKLENRFGTIYISECFVYDRRVMFRSEPPRVYMIERRNVKPRLSIRMEWHFFFWFGGILGSASRAEVPVSRKQPWWHYAWIALQQHSPLLRKFCPPEDWLRSRCLTSVIARELVFPSWHQPLTWDDHWIYFWSRRQ